MRIVNWILLVIALAGAAMVMRDRPHFRRLRAEKERLETVVGHLELRDRSRHAAVAVETGEPYHFLWRIYSPTDELISIKLRSMGGESHLTASLKADRETTLLSRLIFDQNYVQHFFRSPSSAMSSGMFGAQEGEFLKSHWEDLQVEGVGVRGTETFDPDTVTDWLRITIPPELIPEATQVLGADSRLLKTQPLIAIRIGTDKAFEDEERRAAQQR